MKSIQLKFIDSALAINAQIKANIVLKETESIPFATVLPSY